MNNKVDQSGCKGENAEGSREMDGKVSKPGEKGLDSTVNASTWDKIMSTCHVNRELLSMKAHFFFFFGALAGVIPPLILYCQQLGASVSMVGVLFAVLPFIQCVSKPIAGGIADKWQRHKTVFLTSLVVLAVALFSINFIPESETPPSTVVNFSENATFTYCDESVYFSACPSNIHSLESIKMQRFICSMTDCAIPKESELFFLFMSEKCNFNQTDCVGFQASNFTTFGFVTVLSNSYGSVGSLSSCPEFNVESFTNPANRIFKIQNATIRRDLCLKSSFKCVAKCSSVISNVEQSPDSVAYAMVWLWIGCIIAWSAYAIILSISDAILMNALGENRSAFGYTRLYSSIGWGLLSAVAAQIIDYASIGRAQKNYSPGFYIFLGLIICDIVTAIRMKVVISERPHALAKDLWTIFKQLEVIVFSVAVILQGMITGFLWTFIVVYANELNGSQLVIGLNYAVECFLSEIPFFIISGWIVDKLGHSNSMSLVLLITGFKTLCYSFIYNAWYMLVIALCHGVTYGVMYSTIATYASTIAPSSLSASIQGIFQALLEGAGVGLGNLLGGFVYEEIGGRLAFRVFGISLLGISVAHWLTSSLLRKWKARRVGPEVELTVVNVSDNFVDVNLETKTDAKTC
ncbi:hypothetical protein CHUAL_001570 [Chamberlinius hualienensis]